MSIYSLKYSYSFNFIDVMYLNFSIGGSNKLFFYLNELKRELIFHQ